MVWRSLLVLVLGLSITTQAKTHKTTKTTTHSKKKKAHKARKVVSRDKVREESMAVWPTQTEMNPLVKVGVPELDRLLVDRPPLGSPLTEDPSADLDSKRPMAIENRDRGLASVAMTDSRDPLVRLKQVAEPLLGSPYRTGGETTAGFDCSGFVLTVLRAFGQNLTGRSSGEFYKQGYAVDRDHLQTGDLLFFADHHRAIGHVGIYLAEGKFIHSSVGRGVMVSGLDEKYYLGKYKAARRHDSFAAALSADPAEPGAP